MRSQAFIRRSRSLLKASLTSHSSNRPSGRLNRLPRRNQDQLRTTACVSKRLSSSTASSPPDISETPPAADAPGTPPEVPQPDEPEKPKRRTRALKDSDTSPQLPSGLDILWTPQSDLHHDSSLLTNLPPREILEEALNNIHVALHPQTQHRATYASPAGSPVEPTLALYCPIEGGDYIIDETVRELALRTGSEVVVLDAVQLSAGEWGHFGKAATSLQLPRNPLHFPSSSPHPYRQSHPQVAMDDDEEQDFPTQFTAPSQMTLHVMAPASSMRGRAYIGASSRGNSSPSKIKSFFDELINIPGAQSDVSDKSTASTPRKPRIIYIRDFPTLAPSSATWYPPLLSAVRQRRQGPISRPTSPITNPMTIVFGITPPITALPSLPPPGSGQQSFMNILMNRSQSPSLASSGPKPGKSEWNEDETADKAREKRLRERLRKWEKGDAALEDELPSLFASSEAANDGNGQRPDVVVIGGPSGMSGLPSQLGSMLMGRSSGRGTSPEAEANSRFFRTSILVPSARSIDRERSCRVARRREINELTIRMGIGAVGGVLSKRDNATDMSDSAKERDRDPNLTPEDTEERMWDDWGNRIEVWSSVRQIADRALGSVVAYAFPQSERSSLDPTDVPWDAVHRAWAAQRSSGDIRKEWSKKSSSNLLREQSDEVNDETDEGVKEDKVDEVIERIRQDPELEQHESRLLPCIVDSGSMPTSFNQVHLPPHTIDSVRTIVSLPLLHPAAFQHGILKEYGMTGCLLFGPPGTGKTLVVRALAREAGCRMMAISPSDVMDMYVGEGEKLVKAVFSLARRLSPCVVFLDEIDALFGARMSARESGGAFAHRGVITEFMQEMDGLKSSKDDRVIVIGATNRPFDLDDAVLRRLPRRLLVDLPGEKEREEILKILLRDEILAPDLDLHTLAKRTESFSGSDLKHLCVSAALDAVKERVDVPWNPSSTSTSASSSTTPVSESLTATSEAATNLASTSKLTPPMLPPASSPLFTRNIALHNFTKALKEITPSSSESLGTLAELRKWNEEFGEGRRDKRKKQVWGRGNFGFSDGEQDNKATGDEGRVAMPNRAGSGVGTTVVGQ